MPCPSDLFGRVFQPAIHWEKLGSIIMKTLTASDIMTRSVVSIGIDAPLTEAIRTMLDAGISGMPVLDDSGMLAGIISEHDLMNFAFSGNAHEATVREAMTSKVISFEPGAPIQEIVNCFAANRIRRVPIASQGRVEGIVSRRDVLREIARMYGT